MPLISDNSQSKILDKYKLNIKTKYISNNKILEKNTDNSYNDDISKGIRCKKEYYLKNKLLHTENIFDSRIEYTFISKNQENKDFTCLNCGMHSKLKSFVDGCPYCKSHYNIDYTNKELGSKHHYDLVLKSNTYKIITGIIDYIFSFLLFYTYIKLKSRTFNSYDISKIFIYSLILSLILYYFFYLLDAYIILKPIKNYKKNQNQNQIEFWEKTKINKTNFFNNFNYELGKYYYNKDNIIDYDILDYIKYDYYEKNNIKYVDVSIEVRLIYFKNNRIIPKYLKETFTLENNNSDTLLLKKGANIIKCASCGATIDITKGKCEYCKKSINSLQEWILINK